jgi:hypothetical protein
MIRLDVVCRGDKRLVKKRREGKSKREGKARDGTKVIDVRGGLVVSEDLDR